MKDKLEALVKRIDTLNTELSHEDVTKDMERYKKISKEHSEITPIVEIYKKYQKITQDIDEARELLSDPEMKEFAQEEIDKGDTHLEEVEIELLKLLIPKD
ncbi:MAG: PCRF domain-containing protein, partial [Nitrosomonadales bacterium]|nr:PCRF domain-containing protein [Nitrosomonadales bacterium]